MKICNPTEKEIVIGNNTIVATVDVIDQTEIHPFDEIREFSQTNVSRA